MRIILIAVVLCPLLSWAQLTDTTEPKDWQSSSMLDFGFGLSRVNLSHNSPETVRAELLDATLVERIGKSIGLTDQDLATVRVVAEPDREWISLYQLGKSDKAFDALGDALRDYIRARQGGHTKACMMAAVTNQVLSAATHDTGIRAIASARPLIPISWLRKGDTGSITNKAGKLVSRTVTTSVVDGKTVTNEVVHIPKTDEVCQWASYTLVDGDICWRYFVLFKADGSVDYVHDSRSDAKEVDPKYADVINQVEAEVTAEMKKDGTHGQFGSCHSFWSRKKEKLKKKGIVWRSPSELNPDTCFD